MRTVRRAQRSRPTSSTSAEAPCLKGRWYKPFLSRRHPIGQKMTYVDRAAAPIDFVVSETLDEELQVVRQAQGRDMRAFERLYRTHVGRVHAICLRMTANMTRAEE